MATQYGDSETGSPLNRDEAEEPVAIEVEPFLFAQTPETLIFDLRVSPGAFRLYAALVRYGSDPEHCRPGMRTISARLGVDIRTVRRWVSELEQTGWVERRPRFVDGRQTSNGYFVRRSVTELSGDSGVSALPDSGVSVRGDSGDNVRGRTRAIKNESKKNDSKTLVAVAPSDSVAPLHFGESASVQLEQRGKAYDQIARRVLKDWYETQNPRPAQNFVGMVASVKKMLVAGWRPEDVRYALDEAPVVSVGALTFALGKRKKGAKSTGTDYLLGLLQAMDGMSEAEQEQWWNEQGPGRIRDGK